MESIKTLTRRFSTKICFPVTFAKLLNELVWPHSLFADVHGSESRNALNVVTSHNDVLLAVDKYLDRHIPTSTGDIYSHVRCSHLPHDVSFPPATHFTGLVPLELYAPPDTQRACLLSNVCLNDDGQIEFYLHPHSRRLPEMYLVDGLKQGLVRIEGIGGLAWSPIIKRRAMPPNYVLNDDADVHMYTSFIANNNFGHNLIDNVFTHYFAMQHFNVGSYNTSRLISGTSCVSVTASRCLYLHTLF